MFAPLVIGCSCNTEVGEENGRIIAVEIGDDDVGGLDKLVRDLIPRADPRIGQARRGALSDSISARSAVTPMLQLLDRSPQSRVVRGAAPRRHGLC